MGKITDIGRWRNEITLAEEFRKKEFGEYTAKTRTKAGENIDYFEKGFSAGYELNGVDGIDDSATTLNLFHVVTKLIVPSLYFQNPQVQTKPKRKQDEDSAPTAKGIMNYYYKEIGVDSENEMTVWDSYVLNRGVTKVGYTTKFGMDIDDPEIKKKKKSVIDKALEQVGLKKKEKEEPLVKPEVNHNIIAEFPYVRWVSPFKFLMDPRARNIDEAMWVCEEFDKTVGELKRNTKYKNTQGLVGSPPEVEETSNVDVESSQIEEFSVVRLYEIHYINNNVMYRLVIVKDGSIFKELYHEKSIYEMDGFQYDIVEFNRHGHLQYKRSDLTKIKNIQDRISSTFDGILEQLDTFVPKIAYNANDVTPNGVKALRDGGIGAIIETNKNPREAIAEIGLTQFKQDLKAFVDNMVDTVTIMTGVTQSKLLGVTAGRTATGETIAQGGENIRLSDMTKSVQRMVDRQATKLWQVIRQFVPLEDLQIITGESGIDPKTGNPMYTWLPDIDDAMSQKLSEGQYRFDIEVGSTQKIDSALITKRIENLISILGRTDIIALMQQQGKKVDLAEVLRLWLLNTPEIVRDPSKIISDVTDQTQGLVPAQEILTGGGAGGFTNGSANNAQAALQGRPPETADQLLQESAQQ
jgi:hypothetical protein